MLSSANKQNDHSLRQRVVVKQNLTRKCSKEKEVEKLKNKQILKILKAKKRTKRSKIYTYIKKDDLLV